MLNFNLLVRNVLVLAALMFIFACSPQVRLSKKVATTFDQSALLNRYQVGFALYDYASHQMIWQKDADKYYTPASNTKLFTFYAGLKIAPDSIPSLRYVERGDSLIFWGTGDPSLLHQQLKGTRAIDFLKSQSKHLYFAAGRYLGDFYGSGWAWDDYNDDYQPEISELPLYGNVANVSTTTNGAIQVIPADLSSCFHADSTNLSTSFSVKRDFLQNNFQYPATSIPKDFRQEVPFKTSTTLTLSLLSTALGKEVRLAHVPFDRNAKTIFSNSTKDVLKNLMLPSDNFIAEQLLLTYADRLNLPLKASSVIAGIKKNYLDSLPDEPKWVDGSGLSRQNLFTPRSMIKLLEMIYQEVNNRDLLFDLLPAGGKSGTLRNAYPKTDHPFVFAKTGTLSGVHNQSGYLVTKNGKLLLFSFMNNNYVQSTAEVRKEMVRVMTFIHDNY
jgi:D-alanyl-D-alanine carboxypeptidase/D-alanyl-D-alanine-endopeptidase (penicillin-binding protein 4)